MLLSHNQYPHNHQTHKIMKKYNKFTSIIAGAAALVATGLYAEPSDESVIIRLTGSTAFRAATHSAIVAMYDSAPVAGYAGSNLSGSGRSFFYGTIGGTKTIVTTSWSGSTGGIQVVAGSIPVGFMADTLADSTSTPALTAAGAGATGGTQISSSSSFGSNSKVADVAMGDTFQSSTPFKTPVLNSQTVGVIGFVWLANRGLSSEMVSKPNVTLTSGSAVVSMADVTGIQVGMNVKASAGLPTSYVTVLSVDTPNNTVTLSHNATAASTTATLTFARPAPITNINTQQAQALWGAGTASLAQFTGNAADASTLVYATGRDPDSGTRLTAFAEAGIGANATVTQYRPTVASGVITALNPYPQQVVNGITFTEGNGGESSGGTLSGYFGNVSTPGLIVSYVGSGDAPGAVNNGAVQLTYNGVPYSLDGIKEGRYTFWCYQHVMYQPTISAAKKTVADLMADKIRTVTAPIKLSEMKCSRATDGAVVFHD
jgi:hypothetical protein